MATWADSFSDGRHTRAKQRSIYAVIYTYTKGPDRPALLSIHDVPTNLKIGIAKGQGREAVRFW